MKNKKIKLIAVLFIGIILITGCDKDGSVVNPEQITIDINGEWTGHLLMDGSGAERTADSTYILNIVQNKDNWFFSNLVGRIWEQTPLNSCSLHICI
ncbi:MAG: hypothetical protein COX49_04630 [bacterium (Candidatus Stahlbacteria) CG23_combo_of_CG06-09_8_20_14_all_40_9]|nr:MAG: hypothetical protein COX49_04630 [bacterium (Candidatus Stahlbacteria) CG23_combo_of_CG06-09_8_20_14_all_40_9]